MDVVPGMNRFTGEGANPMFNITGGVENPMFDSSGAAIEMHQKNGR